MKKLILICLILITCATLKPTKEDIFLEQFLNEKCTPSEYISVEFESLYYMLILSYVTRDECKFFYYRKQLVCWMLYNKHRIKVLYVFGDRYIKVRGKLRNWVIPATIVKRIECRCFY